MSLRARLLAPERMCASTTYLLHTVYVPSCMYERSTVQHTSVLKEQRASKNKTLSPPYPPPSPPPGVKKNPPKNQSSGAAHMYYVSYSTVVCRTFRRQTTNDNKRRLTIKLQRVAPACGESFAPIGRVSMYILGRGRHGSSLLLERERTELFTVYTTVGR